MEEYQLTLGIEPTNDYEKAKQDLLQAIQSIQKLSPLQQQMLAKEFFETASNMALLKMFQRYWR